ncbi:YggS family pyridoxal phosphate-dependent enzyme [Tissierella creatinini]|nr:YggS family pyridoxal phosphate-dependent enzyme [Tissierella creatinini]TJX69256.1 YggS family pyridoxal phosphate-dependent enzyme [Soehngenia saccharolytica]
MSIAENLELVKNNIEKALIKTGRKDKIELIAVTKTIDVDRIKEAISLGVTNIGENKVQELEIKIPILENSVNYHMIGYLQTNKVKYIIDKVKLIHSLDRISLAKELDKRANQKDCISQVLLQVNVAEEETKSGLKVNELLPFIEEILELEHIKIRGLMTIAPNTTDESLLRSVFRTLYKLKEDISGRHYKNISMDYLSMGMTNDYTIAIEEGSNMVRVGTGIFGKRK